MRHRVLGIWLSLLLALLIGGCSPLIKIEQPTSDGFIQLNIGETIGQTFVARYQGLAGIVFFIKPGQSGNGTLHLHLKSDPQASDDLASAAIPLESIQSAGNYRFNFPPLKDTQNQDYYATLSLDQDSAPQASVAIGSGPANAYLNGSGYQNDLAQENQLAFRLVYDSNLALAGLIRQGLSWMLRLLAGLFLFTLPGWALFSLLWKRWDQLRWEEKLGLASSLSLAIYPLLFLWTNLTGLHLGPLYAWLPPLVSLGFLVWKNRNTIRNPRSLFQASANPQNANKSNRSWTQLSEILPSITLLAVLGLVFGVRFWVIRDLDLPMWGDSQQHTMIAQLLVDHGGLFNSWQPYAELLSFTYHFGFHTLVAVFHWVTGLSLPQSVLWTGQILNGLAVLALYPLATKMGKSRWAGVAAVLVAGLLVPMPMFYVNWGRYTQLAGQAILISVIYLVWSLIEDRNTDWGLIGLIWIAFGGLALAHYRVLIFGVLFVIALFLLYAFRIRIRTLILRLFWAGLGGAVLYLPWFIHVFGGQIMVIFAHQVTTPVNQTASSTQEYNAIGNLLTYLPAWLWLLLVPILAWGLWRKKTGISLIALWWLLMVLAANPQWFKLPGVGTLSNFAVFIAAYIPASVLFGAAIGWLDQAAKENILPRLFTNAKLSLPAWSLFSITLAAIVLTAGLLGTRQRRNEINPAEFALGSRPDLRAFDWIKANIPENAGFLVNSFLAYGGTTAVGSDGGWWLPLLTERRINLPPITYGFEREPWPGYKKWVQNLTADLIDKGIDDPQVLAMLAEQDLRYVYIGQFQGSVNYNGPFPLAPDKLLASQHFQPIYHQDRVWIFEMVPAE